MNRTRSIRVFTAATLWTVVSLVACTFATGAASASSAEVHVSTKTATIGQLVQVTGTGWAPVGQIVQIELCGQNARNVSSDCDQANQYTAAIRAGGVFYGALITHLPPSPCPCVVLVANEGAFSGVRIPITVIGAPTAPIPPEESPPASVAVSARVLGSLSVGSWFGGPKAVTLELRITNRSTASFGSPVVSVTVGRGRSPSEFVVAKSLGPLGVGAKQVLRIPVILPAFTFGNYSVRAQVITGQGQFSKVVATSSYPWGLFVMAALVLQMMLLLVRNRVRARLGRQGGIDMPPEDTEMPEVVGLRTVEAPLADVTELPADALVRQNAPGQLEIVDLRWAPDDAWIISQRMALFLPEDGLTCRVEVLACPVIRLQRTTVLVWADFALSPWDALHEANLWAEMRTDSALGSLAAGQTFRYNYRGLRLELVLRPLGRELHLAHNQSVQRLQVRGSASFDNETSAFDIESILERTWVDQPPAGVSVADYEPPMGSLTYGQVPGGDSFFLRFEADGRPNGWLMRDGGTSQIVTAQRRVEERAGPYPLRMTVELSDELDRSALVKGLASNGMASRDRTSLLLECRMEWSIDGASATGEDRELISVDGWREWRAGDQLRHRLVDL